MIENNIKQPTNSPWHNWRGIDGWNYYFLLKFALLWYGYLNFHPLTNLVFLAFLLFPMPSTTLHRVRNWVAIPIGLVLFYYDTWLPGINSLLGNASDFFSFSAIYHLDLLERFINWRMIGAAFVLLVGYLFISQWIRITVFTVGVLIWLNIVTLTGPAVSLVPAAINSTTNSPASPNVSQDLPPTNTNLTAYLNKFFNEEKGLYTNFPTALPADAQPFDLLIINVCSLAWSDVDAVQLQNHPLWRKFDILFDHFNSAASYSGPAAIRLLRASCGQTPHVELYKPVAQHCYLFDNLAKLGFTPGLMLDHTGAYGNFLNQLRQYGNLHAPLMSQAGIKVETISFNGMPIYNDGELLNRWIEQQKNSTTSRSATFFNVTPLHDGDHYIGEETTAPYKPRAEKLFDTLDNFFNALEKSGRRVMVIMLPEHGANLTGDKLQMPGLRDLPSPTITNIPVGVKLIGLQIPHKNNPLHIDTPSSYLAISELVSRLVDGKAFSAPTLDWQTLTEGLPQTTVVSENDGSIVMLYQGKFYIRLNGDAAWVPYPQ